MNHPLRVRRPQLLALVLVALALDMDAGAADLRTRLNVRQEASEVVLGETMNDYYQGNSFAALNRILLAKAMGRIDESVTSSELLLGDLYTAFGMPDEADSVFSRVTARDMRSQTRNETLFRKGRLRYHQGDYFEAERILNEPLDTQMTPIEVERRIMLANVLMARHAFPEAQNVLSPVGLDGPLGAYATYNIGVSKLRSEHAAEGVHMLEQVMNLPVSDNETNALKDRAALAIGYDYLQAQQPEKARDALITVRLKGPFSTNALLALGWANYERKDYKRALSYWLELLTRDTADPSVQEAMLLAPRAYEALQARQQALYGYKLAAATLGGQLETLEKLEKDIHTPGWLDTLSPGIDHNGDPMAVPDSVAPRDPTTVSQLYGLFSQHPFNEGFQQYEQLQRLRALLDKRLDDLHALRDMAALMRKRKGELAGLTTRAEAAQKRLDQVADRWPVLEKRARQEALSNKTATPSSGGIKNLERQFKLQQAETRLAKLPDTAASRALRYRLQVLKGLVLMENASKVPLSQEQIYADIASNESQLRLLQMRMEAVQRLLADNRKVAGSDNDARIAALETRLEASRKAVDRSLDEYGAYLRQLAESQLEDSRNRINTDLAEAHLSIARLQDASLLHDDRQAGTEKLKP